MKGAKIVRMIERKRVLAAVIIIKLSNDVLLDRYYCDTSFQVQRPSRLHRGLIYRVVPIRFISKHA